MPNRRDDAIDRDRESAAAPPATRRAYRHGARMRAGDAQHRRRTQDRLVVLDQDEAARRLAVVPNCASSARPSGFCDAPKRK